MKKTLLAALLAAAVLAALRRRRRRPPPPPATVARCRRARASRSTASSPTCRRWSPRRPTCSSRSTPAPSSPPDRRDQRADRRSTETREGGGPRPATLSIAAMRSLHALTGALAAGLFLAVRGRRRSARRRSRRRRDDEVIEVLPASAGNRGEDRQLRKRLAARPDDAALAMAVARRYLEQARESGDPRFAGLALAALRAWPDASAAPDDVLLMRATLQQYLHEFDAAVAHLRLLLARPGSERQRAGLADAGDGAARAGPLRRLRRRLPRGRPRRRRRSTRPPAWPRTRRCAARPARRGAASRRCSRGARLPPATRGWLTTSLAELEERDGRAAAADAAYRSVPRARPRHLRRDRLCRLPDRPAPAGRGARGAEGRAAHRHRRCCAWRSPARWRASAAAAARRRRDARAHRPGQRAARGAHLPRPRAGDVRARRRARRRSARSRSRAATSRASASRSTCSCFAQAARASGQRDAIEEARRLKASIGLHDRRIDALL